MRLRRGSDRKAEALKQGSKYYPVHFSRSDTSGEKPLEEFVTAEETADLERFASLGVITGKPVPDREKLERLLEKLTEAFEGETTKAEIVRMLQEYLPNFEHIETGKSLDSKM